MEVDGPRRCLLETPDEEEISSGFVNSDRERMIRDVKKGHHGDALLIGVTDPLLLFSRS